MSRPSITRDSVTNGAKESVNDRSRAWCFTTFNEDDITKLMEMGGIKAFVVGREVCPTTSKVHYQGYVRFGQVVRFSWWKNQFFKVHVEPRRATEFEAAEYCRKEGDVLYDFGCEGPSRKKFKGDQHEQCAEMISQGATKGQVHREMGPRYYYLNCRKINDYMEAIMNMRCKGEQYLS